ncbi:phage tail termination protein [Enterobacter pseudoroggenkampii]|uniref:phage tail termination protein n=1 Tax=Enterobacter pseudoroggenkampii TaxID=2996112 RepID=UPI0038A1FED9
MTPMMHERVRNMFGDAGLTAGFTVQQLMYDDPGDLSKAIMVFRPNGGSAIRYGLGTDYYVLVDVVGAKDKRKEALNAVRRIVEYVQDNPMADECVGYIQNMGAIPAPVPTEEGRIVFRLQFACTFGD